MHHTIYSKLYAHYIMYLQYDSRTVAHTLHQVSPNTRAIPYIKTALLRYQLRQAKQLIHPKNIYFVFVLGKICVFFCDTFVDVVVTDSRERHIVACHQNNFVNNIYYIPGTCVRIDTHMSR